MNNKIFKELLHEIKEKGIDGYNYEKLNCFNTFSEQIYKDIEKFSKYTFDGRFQTILYKGLAYASKDNLSYNDFLVFVKTELEKLSVPCIIIIPLNYINNDLLEKDIYISNNVVLFKTDKPKLKKSTSKGKVSLDTPLSKYFKENAKINLLREHIESAKDGNFFNFPILTILINNIDWRVENESGRIVEMVYSLIRMLDFENELEECGWGYLMRCKLHSASTYGVYYGEEGVNKLPKGSIAETYGYSMRFKFQPYLDVSTKGFLTSLDRFESILLKFLNCCFMNKENCSEQQLMKIAKWQNSFNIFNTAYELAASEHYDSALLLLLTILESLFIKNTGNKKESLVLALQENFKENEEFTSEFIRKNIEQAYKSRNKFVHEGQGVENEYVYSKSLNSYQGIYPGMKPFAYIGLCHYPSNIENIINLFKITINSIIEYGEL